MAQRIQNPEVQNLTITDVLFNLSIAPFDSMPAEDLKRIAKLLPQRHLQAISFLLTGVNSAIANAVRSVTLTELKARSLDFDTSKVETTDNEIILANLYDRIALIYLDQDCPLDAVFSLNASAANSEEEYKVITSENIVQIRGKKMDRLPFERGHRIVELRPGRSINIPEIRVIEGHGYEDSKWSVTSEFEFQERDYVRVGFLNSRGNINNSVVSRMNYSLYYINKRYLFRNHFPNPTDYILIKS